MHDLTEGIVVYDIGGILQVLIDSKVITLEIINNRVETFPYGEHEKAYKARPLFFSQEKGGTKIKVKQSSVEMLCLTRYLGLMIGDLIPANNTGNCIDALGR